MNAPGKHGPDEDSGGSRIISSRPNFSGPGPQVMAAETLRGDRVLNPKGAMLGEVRDIMIDVQSGQVAYLVLSFGGVMGIGDKLFAIPWSALTLDADRHCFLLDIDPERLRAAPGFDKNHWPSMADPYWTTEVRSFYQQRST